MKYKYCVLVDPVPSREYQSVVPFQEQIENEKESENCCRNARHEQSS